MDHHSRPPARFIIRGSGTANTSGQYPNETQPGGFQFDTPAVATASNSAVQGATSHAAPSSASVENGTLVTNQQTPPTSSATPSLPHPTALPGDDSTGHRTQPSLSLADDDQMMLGSDNGMAHQQGLRVAEDEMKGEVETGRNWGDTIEGDDSGSDIPTKKPKGRPPKKPRKPVNRKRKQDDQSPEPVPRKPATRKPTAQKPGAKKAAAGKSAVDQEAVDEDQTDEDDEDDADGEQDEQDEDDEDDERTAAKTETKNPQGSKQAAKIEQFADAAYTAARSLYPSEPIYEDCEPIIESDTATATLRSTRKNKEVQDLIRLLGDLAGELQRESFDFGQTDIVVIDKGIFMGFKIRSAPESKDENGEGPIRRPNALNLKHQRFAYNGLNENIKPLNRIDEIFDDLTNNALEKGLNHALEALKFQKLKVSTLFSGTESPLLAMQMVRESLKKFTSYDFEIEHQFSCEIEPMKQAYIQRNFGPAILFRDALELGGKEAHTAFGAKRPVPDFPDIMVAGSSCIDYSMLNNKRKAYDEAGESRETADATVEYARNHGAKIVILENVLKAPWGRMELAWQEAGYATKVALLDSKDFYMPQTRQRGYMIGISREVAEECQLDADKAVNKWFGVMERLQRRASSPFTDFIFDDDDPQLRIQDQEAAAVQTIGRPVSWEMCKKEVLFYRASNFLGPQRPFTNWENSGSCNVPDSCFKHWFKKQVERIWDTIDINHLRSIAWRGYDMSHKVRCIDVSQGVRRETDGTAWGTIRCLTPSASPYLFRRGGPLIGLEALALQGIPREKLILNREPNKYLQDLAGNAMTTTVVGSAMLAALICAWPLLDKLPDRPKSATKSHAKNLESTFLEYDPKWQLVETDLTAGPRPFMTTDEIRSLAIRSMRLCSCESLVLNPGQTFQQCSRCGYASCIACGINPKHKYVQLKDLKGRISAIEFERQMREILPPRLIVRDLFPAHLEAAAAGHEKLGDSYTSAIKAATASECRLVSFKRDQGWTVVYEGRCSRLVLTFRKKWDGQVLCDEALDKCASNVALQWRFYAKPNPELPAKCVVRDELSQPIARLTCSASLLEGLWEVRTVLEASCSLEVTGAGEKVPSWEKRQGLQEPRFKHRLGWPTLGVQLADSSAPTTSIARHIIGTYDMLPDCGTACGSLHVKRKVSASSSEGPVFLFLDPHPFGNASHDSFVFADQHDKLGLKEVRDSFARIKAGWRPSGNNIASRVDCYFSNEWVRVNDVGLREHAPEDLRKVCLASSDVILPVNGPSCDASGVPVIWCEFSMAGDTYKELKVKDEHTGLVKNPFSFEPLSWLLKTAANSLQSTGWVDFPLLPQIAARCECCAPNAPSVVWKYVKKASANGGYRIQPHENVEEASNYERKIKEVPEAATARLSYRADSELAALKVDFNILTLVHKAVAALADSGLFSLPPSTTQWRAVLDHGHYHPVTFPQIQLKNCHDHPTAPQPPSFSAMGQALNKPQLKSLDWMISQEEDPIKIFEEQEIVEAVVPSMSLRLEAKATAHRRVRGGVLADDVGYGKTALVIALIDRHFQNMKAISSPPFKKGEDEMVSLKATLILVPLNLAPQWEGEINKFVGHTYNVLVLTKENFVEKSTLSSFQEADIILAPWDLFDDNYFARFAEMTRALYTPTSAGRGFEEWFQMAQKDLRTLMKDSHGLQPDRLNSAWHALDHKKYQKFVDPSKRNKKGGGNAKSAADKRPSKKARKDQVEDAEGDDDQINNHEMEKDIIQIQLPTKPFLPLHACIPKRIIVDEFTYIVDKQRPSILALQAEMRWILSGTPPINTFEGMNTMASFLGTTIGVPDDIELRYQKVRETDDRRVTGGEVFRSYVARHTPHWHTTRNGMAVAFAKEFIRQNTTLVEGIQKFDHYQKISLAAPERLAYFEMYLTMINNDVKLVKDKSGKKKKDAAATEKTSREARIKSYIEASELPEDALISICSTNMSFEMMQESPVESKERSIVETVCDMLSELRGAFWVLSSYSHEVKENPEIYNYLRSVQDNRFGDATVSGLVTRVIARAQSSEKWIMAKKINETGKGKKLPTKDQRAMRANSKVPDGLKSESRAADLKLRGDTLTDMTSILTTQVRDRRFFVGFEDCLADKKLECSSCGSRSKDYSNMFLVGHCGHAGCRQCYRKLGEKQSSAEECFDPSCDSRSPLSSMIPASDFTSTTISPFTHDHGSKMAAVRELLARIPKGEKVLIFVQFDRIMMALKGMLDACKIPFADTTKPGRAAAQVERFKSPRRPGQAPVDVCILKLDSSDAAGWNLQTANHVLFLSSLVSPSRHKYKSNITQAVGRVFRLGQRRPVHVYHFVVEKTIEVNILEGRTGKLLVERGGDCLLVGEGEVRPGDGRHFEGMPFNGRFCSVVGGEEVWEGGEEEEEA